MNANFRLDALEARRLLAAGPVTPADPITFDDVPDVDDYYKYERDDFNVFARTADGRGRSVMRTVPSAAGGLAVAADANDARLRITRDRGAAFDIDGLDYASPFGGTTGEIYEFRATLADGTTVSRLTDPVDFYGSRHIELNLTNVVRLDVIPSKGLNGAPQIRFGPEIDNVAAGPVGTGGRAATFEGLAEGSRSDQVVDAGRRFVALNRFGGSSEVVAFGRGSGYASGALTTLNWGDTIRVTHADAGTPFSVSTLDLAAGRWGEAGDAVITGVRADGSRTDPVTVGFASRAFSTVQLQMSGIVALDVAFGGGANAVYGAIDNVIFADDDGPPPSADITFEDVPVGTYDTITPANGGRVFASDGAGRPKPFLVQGTGEGFASTVLTTADWGDTLFVDPRANSTVASVDVGAGRWGEAGDVTIRGISSVGGDQVRTVSFSGRGLATVELGWRNMIALIFSFGGGVNDASGVIDNVRYGD